MIKVPVAVIKVPLVEWNRPFLSPPFLSPPFLSPPFFVIPNSHILPMGYRNICFLRGKGSKFPRKEWQDKNSLGLIFFLAGSLTIKGGSRRSKISREVLMMMKAAKLGWAGPGVGQEQTMSRPGAGWEQARSRPGAMQSRE